MSQCNSITDLLYTGFYREIQPKLKIVLFIGPDVIQICKNYYSVSSIFMIGVGQTGINITLDFIKVRGRDYYQNEKDLQPDYSDLYLSRNQNSYICSTNNLQLKPSPFKSTAMPRPNCMFVDSTEVLPKKADTAIHSTELLMPQNKIIKSINNGFTTFADGYYGDGSELIEDYMERLYSKLEERDHPSCIQFIHSIDGGTGSGLATGFLERVKDECPFLTIMSFPIFPEVELIYSRSCQRKVMNTILGVDRLQRECDMIFPIDSESLRGISERINWDWTGTDFKLVSMNRIVNDVINDLGVLFDKFITVGDFYGTLIKYPNLKWITPSKLPFAIYDENNNVRKYQRKRWETDRIVDDPEQCLISKDRWNWTESNRKNLCSVVLYQGIEGYNTMTDTSACFYTMETRLGSYSMTQFANDTFIRHKLRGILANYDSILKLASKAVVNEYRNVGMSDDDFSEAKETVTTLISDYRKAHKKKKKNVD